MSDNHHNYIAGQWLKGASEIENRNPSDTRDLIGLYAQASRAQLDSAIAAASEAQRIWARSGLEQRYKVLMAIGQELMQRSAEIGRTLSVSYTHLTLPTILLV